MSFGWIEFTDGRARIVGTVRGADEGGHETFEVQLVSHSGLYGEMRPRWAADGHDFDLEIVSFGYSDERNVGNPHPGARRRFSLLERHAIERMIAGLLDHPEAQRDIFAFGVRGTRFVGGVHFAPNWILGSS